MTDETLEREGMSRWQVRQDVGIASDGRTNRAGAVRIVVRSTALEVIPSARGCAAGPPPNAGPRASAGRSPSAVRPAPCQAPGGAPVQHGGQPDDAALCQNAPPKRRGN